MVNKTNQGGWVGGWKKEGIKPPAKSQQVMKELRSQEDECEDDMTTAVETQIRESEFGGRGGAEQGDTAAVAEVSWGDAGGDPCQIWREEDEVKETNEEGKYVTDGIESWTWLLEKHQSNGL